MEVATSFQEFVRRIPKRPHSSIDYDHSTLFQPTVKKHALNPDLNQHRSLVIAAWHAQKIECMTPPEGSTGDYPDEPMTIDHTIPQTLKNDCIRIDNIDEYLAECGSSDNEEEDVGHLWTTGDSTLVETHIDGSALPMERRAGEKKLRIPEFVLRAAVNSRALQCHDMVSHKSMVMEKKADYEEIASSCRMDLDSQSETSNAVAMELD